MLLKIMDFLVNRQYIELVEWAKAIQSQKNQKLPENEHQIMYALSNHDFPLLLETVKKITYSTKKNHTYSLLLQKLQINSKEIQEQWKFSQKFQKEDEFFNLFVENHIYILQETNKTAQKYNFSSLKELFTSISSPDQVLIDGRVCNIKGLSSLDNFHNLLRDTPVHEEFYKYKKYEKIIAFIEVLDLALQELFSINQIGVVIYQNEVYLVKWVQYIDENQLLSGKVASQSNISVLEEFGVKIGVQLKENLELGNLVVFKNQNNPNETDTLTPLLSLDQSIFLGKKVKRSRAYDLAKNEDCRDFVNDVLARIETGIMLLSKDKSTFVQDPKDLELYVQISLQRVDGMDSSNQRINILRDLMQMNRNPDLISNIIDKLEENYIIFLKELFETRNFTNVLSTIHNIAGLKLFQTNPGLLVQTFVYMVEKAIPDADLILKAVDEIIQNWILSGELLSLLERPQILAISKKVVDRLNRGYFKEVLQYLQEFVQTHPQFRSFNILSLLLQIITNLFRIAQSDTSRIFTNVQFLNFLDEYLRILVQTGNQLKNQDKLVLKEQTQNTFLMLAQDVDFIGFLNEKIIDFVHRMKSIDPIYFPPKSYHQLVTYILHLSPIVIFHKNLEEIGEKVFIFLISEMIDDNVTIEFMTNYVNYFSQSLELFQLNTILFNKTSKLFSEFKNWLKGKDVIKPLLSPLKKEIKILFTSWYLSGRIPQSDFDIHRHLLEDWIDFIEMRDNLEKMVDILYIKDLLWAAEKGDLSKIASKYRDLPPRIFEYSRDMLYSLIQDFISKPFDNLSQFEIIHLLFHYIESEPVKFSLNPSEFQIFVNRFFENLRNRLINVIQLGKNELFHNLLTELGDDLLYIPSDFLTTLYSGFNEIFEYEPSEGERFNARMDMMKNLSLSMESICPKYDMIVKVKTWDPQILSLFIPLQILQEYSQNFKSSSYQIFAKTQDWLIKLSEGNYLTFETVFHPVKLIFQTILDLFKESPDLILMDLQGLIENFFKNQKMLNDNKKAFFKVMIEILPSKNYPKFYPKLQEYRDFVELLADTESLYYTIKDRTRDAEKITTIITRCKRMIQNYPHLFTPWFYYANCLSIQENYLEGIDAYLEALKYETTQGNYARLLHNLLVAYLSTKNYSKAIDMVKNLDMGIKTYPHIVTLIRRIETITGSVLLE